MLPIVLDIANQNVTVIGDGPEVAKRLAMLKEADAKHVTHLKDVPADLQSAVVVFAGDLSDADSAKVAELARGNGILVNVEDKLECCDFHVPALVRRGELVFSISTGGASPRLAKRLRAMLETLFPVAWAEHIQTIRSKRAGWKAEGASFAELSQKTDALLDDNGWLAQDCECIRRAES